MASPKILNELKNMRSLFSKTYTIQTKMENLEILTQKLNTEKLTRLFIPPSY